MKNNSKITQSKLKELLTYNPDTGDFTRLVSKGNVKAGCVTGNKNPTGYIHIGIDKEVYQAHRLVWLYVYGEFPEKQIDHINGIRDDNRIANLRVATVAQNQHNVGVSGSNKTGFKGVSFNKKSNKWYSQIRINGKQVMLGVFNTAKEASIAYEEKAHQIRGEFHRASLCDEATHHTTNNARMGCDSK